jgi:hypothetical protein
MERIILRIPLGSIPQKMQKSCKPLHPWTNFSSNETQQWHVECSYSLQRRTKQYCFSPRKGFYKAMKKTLLALSSVALLALATVAHADTIYTLNVDGCTGGCGTGPYGTVDLAQNGSSVNVKLTLAAGENFAGTGAGDALEFNLLNFLGPISITNITSGFAVGPAPDTASKFGTFNFSVTCSTCSGGTGPSGPLSFTVGDANGVLVSDFAKLSTNPPGDTPAYFAADIFGNGNTGNVGATGTPTTTTTPEPSSLMLLGTGVLGAAGLMRRKMASAINR